MRMRMAVLQAGFRPSNEIRTIQHRRIANRPFQEFLELQRIVNTGFGPLVEIRSRQLLGKDISFNTK